MSSRTEHPPSTGDGSARSRTARQAVIGGVAGIALLVGPAVLADVIAPDQQGDQVEASAASDASTSTVRRNLIGAHEPRAQRVAAQLTTTTTVPPTTTEPPPPPTTEPPPPPTTEPPPPPEENPAPPSTGGGFGDPGDYATWDALAECESGGNWSINTGNGYYGGLQFSAETWHAVGGTGLPHEHSRETQIHYGQILQARSGWGQWPHCASKLGLI